MISLLSYIAVLLSFLARYSSSIHSPTSLNSRQNILYSLCLFSSLAGCGLQKPRKKSGGRVGNDTRTTQTMWTVVFTPKDWAHGIISVSLWMGDSLVSEVTISTWIQNLLYLGALDLVLAPYPTPPLQGYQAVGCPRRRHSPLLHSCLGTLGCVQFSPTRFPVYYLHCVCSS